MCPFVSHRAQKMCSTCWLASWWEHRTFDWARKRVVFSIRAKTLAFPNSSLVHGINEQLLKTRPNDNIEVSAQESRNCDQNSKPLQLRLWGRLRRSDYQDLSWSSPLRRSGIYLHRVQRLCWRGSFKSSSSPKLAINVSDSPRTSGGQKWGCLLTDVRNKSVSWATRRRGLEDLK